MDDDDQSIPPSKRRQTYNSSGNNIPTAKRNASSNFHCGICNIAFKSSKALIQHMLENGPPCDVPMQKCNICNTYWPSAKSRKIHWERSSRCKQIQEENDLKSSLYPHHQQFPNNKSTMTSVSINQGTNPKIPKHAVKDFSRYRGIPSVVGLGGPHHNTHFYRSDAFVKHSLSGAINTEKQDVLGIGHDRKITSDCQDAKVSSQTLDKFVLNHLQNIMVEMGLGGLLIFNRNTMSSSISDLKPSQIKQMPTFEDVKELIQDKLNDPLSSMYRTHPQDKNSSQGLSKQNSQMPTSLVMNFTTIASSLEDDDSSQEDEDHMINITEDEVVEFIRTQVRLDDDSSSHDVDEDSGAGLLEDGMGQNIIVLDGDDPGRLIHGMNNNAVHAPIGNVDVAHDNAASLFQNYIYTYRGHQVYTEMDKANLQLFDILERCNAPLYVFDEIQKWSYTNVTTLSQSRPSRRDQFVKRMEEKVYGKYAEDMQPKVDVVRLSSGRMSAITTFSFKMGLISKLTDPDLMKPSNLLLNLDNPFAVPDPTETYGEANTGTWNRFAHQTLCTDPHKDILVPISLFIDAVSGDKNGNHSLEPVVAVPMIFKRSIRNQAKSWFTLGYIESLKQAHSGDDDNDDMESKDINSVDKVQDYHDTLSHILKELVQIQQEGGLPLSFNIAGRPISGVAKIPIQFVIGDCKGNDILCGRYGSHGEKVKHLVRDCDILTEDADDPYHLCTPFSQLQVQSWNKRECNDMSFHHIRNAFWDVNFGGNTEGIYGSTPPEPLHVFQMGLCVYLVEEFLRDIYKRTAKVLDGVVLRTVKRHTRQSHRGFPILSAFRNGFDKIGTLTGKEKYARIFILYLALMNEDLIKSISEAKGIGADNPPLGLECAKNWLKLVESTLAMGQWLKQDSYPKHTIDTIESGGNEESQSQQAIRRYLEFYKKVVNRQVGNGLCIVKFHHFLHFPRYIEKFGCIPNFDGSSPEAIAKTNTKQKFMLTQKRSSTENYQTACRYYESGVASIANGVLKGKSCATEVMDGVNTHDADNSSDSNHTHETTGYVTGSKFSLELNYIDDGGNGMNEDDFEYRLDIQWTRTKATMDIDPQILHSLTMRLFFHDGQGGCLMPNSTVRGFTEFKKHGVIYRAHPSYRSGKPWNDFAMINVDGYADPVPAKIALFLDLMDSEVMTKAQHRRFMNEKDPMLPIEEWSSDDSYSSSDDEDDGDDSHPYLHRGLWVVVQRASGSMIPEDQLTEYHLESRLATRVQLEERFRLLPIECISGPCFVVESSNRLAFIVDDKSLWSEKAFME